MEKHVLEADAHGDAMRKEWRQPVIETLDLGLDAVESSIGPGGDLVSILLSS